MLFTSITYFLFLASSLIIYYLIPLRARNYFLILVSALFYMYVRVDYIFLIFLIIVFNYLLGISIENAKEGKKRLLYFYLSVAINLGVLIFFKYWNFLIINIYDFAGFFKEIPSSQMPLLNILLPLGLSFYIFQTIGYITDINRGSIKAERNFSRFTLFTLYFPKLLVGPIERASHFLPQLKKKKTFNIENIIEGGKRIAWGLFKKLVVADRIAIYHTFIMANANSESGITIFFASILYTFQIYADFSGYTDIALGTAQLFGYDLMENFKRPLLSKNVSDFWRRWHISLSSWVNDYIFNPITLKNRDWGKWGIFYGLLVSFIVIGIWHGASWNYVFFGILQAFALMYESLTRKIRKKISKKVNLHLYNNLSILITFLFVTFSLIIFQSDTLNDAINIISGIFTHSGDLFYDKPSTLLFMLIGCMLMMMYEFQEEWHLLPFSLLSNKNWVIQQLSYSFLLIYILLAGVFDGSQFIYFAF